MNYKKRVSYQLLNAEPGVAGHWTYGNEIPTRDDAIDIAKIRRSQEPGMIWALVEITRQRIDF